MAVKSQSPRLTAPAKRPARAREDAGGRRPAREGGPGHSRVGGGAAPSGAQLAAGSAVPFRRGRARAAALTGPTSYLLVSSEE